MRRFTAHFFLFLYVFASTELHELAKVGTFITHFAEHQKENKELTLTEFIKIHYFSGNPVDADYEKDMTLPFKTTDCGNYNTIHTVPQPVFFASCLDVIIKTAGLVPYDQSALPSPHLSDIWQPPKIS